MKAAEIARSLGGRKVGGSWTVRCPAHDDRNPSLSIGGAADGTVLMHCFAGCERALVIDTLRDRGLWANSDRHHVRIIRPQPSQAAREIVAAEEGQQTDPRDSTEDH